MRRIKTTIAVVSVTAICLFLAACPTDNQVKAASDAVNKYANTLSSFQDAEIKLHDAGKVPDEQHRQILKAEIIASKAGRDLDAAIAVAAKGGDPQQYIAVAQGALQDLISSVGLNQATYQNLQLAITTVSDALQNAVSLINTLKNNPPPAKSSPSGLAIWLLALGLFPMMAAASGVNMAQVIQVIQLAAELEPVAFDLFVRLGQSLKGKTTEEVLAMNEKLFGKVEDTAQQQLDLLDKPKS